MQLKKIKIIKLSILFTEKTKKKKHTIFSDTCEIKFVVSSITMYNMWCLLWHILHENDNLTLGNGKHITQEPWLFAWEKPHSLVGHELLYASSNGRFYWFTHCFDEGQMLWQQWATPLEHDHHFFFHRLMKKKLLNKPLVWKVVHLAMVGLMGMPTWTEGAPGWGRGHVTRIMGNHNIGSWDI